ncbi:tetratricopeptide repeat protein [Streptomyces sp. NPDC046465]|uniref:tetratricopeptide repeat protein n=1 Tax=Streptomyces sp. NPDC046465 TaxID=3155810 RepID=UPI0033C49774
MATTQHPEFGAAVRQLIRDSGLTLDRIVSASRTRRRVALSRTVLSSWQNGRSRPATWASLQTFLSIVGELSSLPRARIDPREWEARYRASGAVPLPTRRAVPTLRDAPLVRDTDPILLGVRQARKNDDVDPVPPYVERDVDPAVDDALRAAAAAGGMVLLKGDSTAGKTRTAFEAMSRVLPDLPLLCPPRESSFDSCVENARVLAEQGRQCVVWLDELEHFLGSGRLDTDALRRLVDCRSVLLATMRLAEYNSRRPRPTRTAKGSDAYTRIDVSDPVLKAAEAIDLPRVWSAPELARTAAEIDPRLVDALRHHRRHGIAEYLSAGPHLWDRWRNSRYVGGNPRGHALVAAAVDLARSGLSGPLPTGLITSLHTGYLSGEADALLTPEPLDEALAWASQDPIGVSRLLLPVGEDTWRPFDYLVDMLSLSGTAPVVPDEVREAAVAHASSVEERYGVGVSCYRADRGDLALRSLLPSAEAGHIGSMLYVGSILLDRDEEAAAAAWWLRLAKAGNAKGMLNLGVRYSRQGRAKKAEKWWRRAYGLGLVEAGAKLANMHEDRGEHDEAERLWALALEAEVPDAFFRFGILAYRKRDFDEATRLYLEAARKGHREATTNLAQVYFAEGRQEEAEKLYVIAAEAGDHVAMRALGLLNEWRGKFSPPDEAPEDRTRRMSDALQKLFDQAEQEGKWNEQAKSAKEWYRRAAAHGDLMSLRLLGNLYHRRHKYEKAHKCYRRAAKLGDPLSAAYFRQPVLAGVRPPDRPPDVDPDRPDDEFEDDGPRQPTPRTLAVLKAALEIEADAAVDVLAEIEGRPVTTEESFIGCFDMLPAQTWQQGTQWRREMIRCFDDLAHDIADSRLPLPCCTGEEMALHLALEHAAAITEDSPDLAEEFCEGAPARPGDYDWWACKRALLEDDDVLMLYQPWMEGIEEPDNDVNQRLGMANLAPDDWFTPFRDDRPRAVDRGFRSRPGPHRNSGS